MIHFYLITPHTSSFLDFLYGLIKPNPSLCITYIKIAATYLDSNLAEESIIHYTYGWVGGSENGNFPMLNVLKILLHMGVGASKKPQKTLINAP